MSTKYKATTTEECYFITITTEGNIKKDHVLNISGKVSGDDFPNQESMIYDSNGNGLWLGNYETSGDRQSGPVTDLPLMARICPKMDSADLQPKKWGLYS
jgi:hypothetical protein